MVSKLLLTTNDLLFNSRSFFLIFGLFLFQYPSSLLDVGVLLSADVMKSKFKLEDVVLSDGLCQSVAERKQCKDINEAAYKLAMSAASEEAKERLTNKVVKK